MVSYYNEVYFSLFQIIIALTIIYFLCFRDVLYTLLVNLLYYFFKHCFFCTCIWEMGNHVVREVVSSSPSSCLPGRIFFSLQSLWFPFQKASILALGCLLPQRERKEGKKEHYRGAGRGEYLGTEGGREGRWNRGRQKNEQRCNIW